MKPAVFALAVLLVASPAVAEENQTEGQAPEEGLSLMEEGAKLFLKGLQRQMEPAIEGLEGFADKAGPALRSFVEEMGPALSDLAGKVEDWSVYEAPEMLPNGDIIIRRKPAPEDTPEPELEMDEDGATDI
ncbi:MAG: hypothetical protein OQK00_11535 [Rhodobacteraceae bacterium]|nr:hypothetical protein [Paracoccaceae bacterium]MCW9043530.1 hypothetical protein [Pseudopelagicola sp.]